MTISPYVYPGMPDNKEVMASQVIARIAELMQVDKHYMVSPCRKNTLLKPRLMAIAYLRKYYQLPLQHIGKLMGRDHSTIIHSLRTHDLLMQQDNIYRENYNGATLHIRLGSPFELKKYPKRKKSMEAQHRNVIENRSRFSEWFRSAKADDEITLTEGEYYAAMQILSKRKSTKVRTIRTGGGNRLLIIVNK